MLTTNLVVFSVLVGLAVVCCGGALLIWRSARRERDLMRRRALQDYDVSSAPAARRGLQRALHRLGGRVSAGRSSDAVRRELTAAGYHGATAGDVYVGTKVLLFALGLAGFGALLVPAGLGASLTLFAILLGSTALFFLPNLVVAVQRDRRRAEIRRHLPDSIDLLEICVSSGMGLDMAWNSVADEIRRVSPTFSDEMELTNLEMNLGVARHVAMRHMAERTGAEDISSLVALLIQSDRFGASIVDALRTFARTMRETRGQEAGEAAEKMSVKLLFPLVLFIFPALLIVMMGPALIEMMSQGIV